jgi:hypothetical protein
MLDMVSIFALMICLNERNHLLEFLVNVGFLCFYCLVEGMLCICGIFFFEMILNLNGSMVLFPFMKVNESLFNFLVWL